MTFEEVAASLPNGLHDAELHRFDMHFVQRKLQFDLTVWRIIGEPRWTEPMFLTPGWVLRHRIRVFLHSVRFPGEPMFSARAAVDRPANHCRRHASRSGRPTRRAGTVLRTNRAREREGRTRHSEAFRRREAASARSSRALWRQAGRVQAAVFGRSRQGSGSPNVMDCYDARTQFERPGQLLQRLTRYRARAAGYHAWSRNSRQAAPGGRDVTPLDPLTFAIVPPAYVVTASEPSPIVGLDVTRERGVVPALQSSLRIFLAAAWAAAVYRRARIASTSTSNPAKFDCVSVRTGNGSDTYSR